MTSQQSLEVYSVKHPAVGWQGGVGPGRCESLRRNRCDGNPLPGRKVGTNADDVAFSRAAAPVELNPAASGHCNLHDSHHEPMLIRPDVNEIRPILVPVNDSVIAVEVNRSPHPIGIFPRVNARRPHREAIVVVVVGIGGVVRTVRVNEGGIAGYVPLAARVRYLPQWYY